MRKYPLELRITAEAYQKNMSKKKNDQSRGWFKLACCSIKPMYALFYQTKI